uniref:Uncharacterized protein n=1 Tax=Salix viminalis TaxID=40686 RepID=A0A6N2KUD8_SALVM
MLPKRSQVRIRSGANNSLGSSDLGEAHELTVVHLRKTPCRGPSFVDPVVTSSNLTTLILFDKNQAQGDVSLYKFQAQRAFT